jgi:hypothetical protein
MNKAVIINTAFTKLSDGAKSACENEFKVIVTQRNNEPTKAMTGLTEVDPLSSLKRSMSHCLKFIVVLCLFGSYINSCKIGLNVVYSYYENRSIRFIL